jgi:hypothetical protein
MHLQLSVDIKIGKRERMTVTLITNVKTLPERICSNMENNIVKI